MRAMRTKRLSRRSAMAFALGAAVPLVAPGIPRLAARNPARESWTYAGNPARTGEMPGPGLDFNREIVELWRTGQESNDYFFDPCGVADGIVYYLPVPNGISPEVRPLIAVDARSGIEIWRQDPPITDPPSFFMGLAVIADGALMMPTFGGLLVAMDARTGEQLWIFDLQGRSHSFRPAILDGVLYVSDIMSVNAVKLGPTPVWLWKTSLADGEQSAVSSTVSVDDGFVVVSTVSPPPGISEDEKDTTIHVLNQEDGTEAYRYQFQTGGEQAQFAVKDGVLYSRSDNAILGQSFVFSMTVDGRHRWHLRTDAGAPAYPAVTSDRLYTGGSDVVSALNPATGDEVWRSSSLEMLGTDLAIIDSVVYAGTAPPGQNIYALSAADGTLLGSVPIGDRGARVVGLTDGILIARVGTNLAAYGNA